MASSPLSPNAKIQRNRTLSRWVLCGLSCFLGRPYVFSFRTENIPVRGDRSHPACKLLSREGAKGRPAGVLPAAQYHPPAISGRSVFHTRGPSAWETACREHTRHLQPMVTVPGVKIGPRTLSPLHATRLVQDSEPPHCQGSGGGPGSRPDTGDARCPVPVPRDCRPPTSPSPSSPSSLYCTVPAATACGTGRACRCLDGGARIRRPCGRSRRE